MKTRALQGPIAKLIGSSERARVRCITVAVRLVGRVAALRLPAALQVARDALAVVAAELIRPARGRRAVALVRAVGAVVVAVALPPNSRNPFFKKNIKETRRNR